MDSLILGLVFATVAAVPQQSSTAAGPAISVAISGRVTDDEGMPVKGALVLLRRVSESGEPELQPVVLETNVNGDYGSDALPAGGYVIETVGPARPPSAFGVQEYRRTYYPGVDTIREATVLTLKAGAAVNGLNIVLAVVRAPIIEGRVLDYQQSELPVINLVSSPAGVIRHGRVKEDGGFRFIGLPEGRYFLWAVSNNPQRSLAAWQAVDLKAQLLDVVLELRPAGVLRGQITAGAGWRPVFDGLRLGAALSDAGRDIDPLLTQQTAVAPDGTFSLDGLFGERTLRVLGLSTECRTEAVRRNGRTVGPPHVTFSRGETISDVEIVLSCR